MLCRYLELKRFKFPYDVEETIEDKIRAIATEFYGTGAISLNLSTLLWCSLCVSLLYLKEIELVTPRAAVVQEGHAG